MLNNKKILLYGYGNPGREDDGLGNVFVEQMEKWVAENNIEGVEFDSNYQLNIEDADTISDKDIVVFVDASEEDIEDFFIDRVDPSEAKIEFTMHASSPAFVLNLCNQIYNKNPETYLIHIKGYKWEFAEGISNKARENLNKAVDFMKDIIINKKDFID